MNRTSEAHALSVTTAQPVLDTHWPAQLVHTTILLGRQYVHRVRPDTSAMKIPPPTKISLVQLVTTARMELST